MQHLVIYLQKVLSRCCKPFNPKHQLPILRKKSRQIPHTAHTWYWKYDAELSTASHGGQACCLATNELVVIPPNPLRTSMNETGVCERLGLVEVPPRTSFERNRRDIGVLTLPWIFLL